MVGRFTHPRIKWAVCLALPVFFIARVFIPSAEAALTPLEISEGKTETPSPGSWFDRLTRYREHLNREHGTEFAFLFNYTQQAILKNNYAQGKSRGVGYFNLEVQQRLWPQAAAFMEVESDRGRGVDKFIPTFSGFNTNSGDDIDIYIPELYLEQDLFKDKISIFAGKLDLSDWFDGNIAAESGDTQFLSDALINNPAIPFPAKGLGALIKFEPYAWLYFESGAATAKATSTKTGLSDGFNSALFINELGLSPKIGALQGNYRFIFHAVHERLTRIDEDGEQKNSFGYALSFDQEVTKRIAFFFRYGRADERVREIKHFWSFGGQILEPFPGRKLDYLGAGVARSIMGDDYRSVNEEDSARDETIYEVYYNYNLNSFIVLSPDLQVVTHPYAEKSAETAVVCGLRFLLSF